jgi:hypothetical protein
MKIDVCDKPDSQILKQICEELKLKKERWVLIHENIMYMAKNDL